MTEEMTFELKPHGTNEQGQNSINYQGGSNCNSKNLKRSHTRLDNELGASFLWTINDESFRTAPRLWYLVALTPCAWFQKDLITSPYILSKDIRLQFPDNLINTFQRRPYDNS